MADKLSSYNVFKWASEYTPALFIPSMPATIFALSDIVLPNIPNATIIFARLRLKALSHQNLALFNNQYIQVQKLAGGTWTNAILLKSASLTETNNTGMVDIPGAIDISGEVNAFNQTIQVRWNQAQNTGSNGFINNVYTELEIIYVVDSGVEAKIDLIKAVTDVIPNGGALTTLQGDITNILADTAEMQPKLPTNNIMGSGVKTDKDDEIDSIKITVEKIEDAIIVKYGTVTLTGSQLIFQTNMTEGNTYWNDTTIIMLTGNNAGQPRRILAFVNLNGQVTVDSPFLNNVTLNDTFIVLGRWTPAGSSLTPAGIAAAVMSEPLPGSYTGNQAGKVIADIKVDSSAILVDTAEMQPKLPANNIMGSGVKTDKDDEIDAIKVATDNMNPKVNSIFGKLPSVAFIKGTADADGGFDIADKADLQQEATDALNAYDPPTRAEATADKAEIIVEVNANETKIDAVKVDTAAILLDTAAIDGRLPTDPADESLVEAAILASESNIRGADGDDLKDLSDEIAGVSAQVAQIQNNMFFSATVLENYQRPQVGTRTINFKAQAFDNSGNPEDPDGDVLSLKLVGAISGELIPATPMTKLAVGVYSLDYAIDATDTLEDWEFTFAYFEGGVSKTHFRNSQFTEFSSDLNDIQTKVTQIHVKTDAGTPAPTIPAQIATHDSDIKGLTRIEACPDLMYVPFGRTMINLEGGITAIALEIPVQIADNLLSSGMVKIQNEYVIYNGIVDSKLQVTLRGAYGTVAATHNNNINVTQSIVYPVRLVIFDNAGNMKNADVPPTLEIEDWKGTQELAPTAMTAISTGIYGYNYIVNYGEVPENKLFKFSATVDGITTQKRNEVVIIDQPASSIDLIQLVGGGAGQYPVTQDGWYDDDGILHAWTDVLAGVVKDVDTGAPLNKAFVTAYLYENGEALYNGRPPGQAKTRVNGTWIMFLDAYTYFFVIEKDGFRIANDGTILRTVG